MMSDPFESSDSVRSAEPLKYLQSVRFDEPFALERGGQLPAVTVAYETYGKLSAARDNAVLVCHAISGDSHVAAHDGGDEVGWWQEMVGPGKPIDTDRYFVVCSNVLGGCRGSTGPGSTDPATGRPFGADFPLITIGDMVALQRRLQQHLDIPAWLAVTGGSLGGHQAMLWAIRHPEAVRGCIAIATSPRLTSQALAFDVVARNAIERDPYFHEGRYYYHATKPDVGLAIARMLGHITYLSPEAMGAKFDLNRHEPHDIQTAFEKRFSVGSYLAYQGHKFVERFDANSYVTISLAMDLFDLGATHEQRVRTFAPATCAWQVVSFSSDWLFTPGQSRQIVDALLHNDQPVSYCDVTSNAGHDGFLLEPEVERYGKIVAAFLRRVSGGLSPPPCQGGAGGAFSDPSPSNANQRDEGPAATQPAPPPGLPLQGGGAGPTDRTSIFHDQRLEAGTIIDLIPPGSRVLDLGCGNGELLAKLRERGHEGLLGVEVAEAYLIGCAQRGVDVIDHDLNTGLASFADQQFDLVVLSQTLQAVANTELILDEMLRVGGRAIVCFPNFAYRELRRIFAEEGRLPRMPGEYEYEWFNTPNRRFPTILDFDELCRLKQIAVEQTVYLETSSGRRVTDDPNLNADTAVYVLRRGGNRASG